MTTRNCADVLQHFLLKIDSAILKSMMYQIIRVTSQRSDTSGLTPYEREVLRLIAENNGYLKENNAILQKNRELLIGLAEDVRKIKYNTNSWR